MNFGSSVFFVQVEFLSNLVEQTAVWYNKLVALPSPGNGKEVQPVDNNLLSFFYSILASVVAHYICKRFDEWR